MTRNDIAPRRVQPSRLASVRDWPALREHPVRTPLIGIVVVAYAWFIAGFEPFTTKSLVGVIIPGAVLGVIAYGRPPERIAPPEQLDIFGMSYWMIILGALFEWEASAFRDNSLAWHPSLTDLVNPLLSTHVTKTLAIVLWLMAGWGLVKR
ncbi:MAG TPA: hypothetical protein VH641_11665 [Streptosporangiaceae bacterium]|jgi:hypothetical protein